MKQERLRKVGFVGLELKKAFKKLKSGKVGELELADYLDRVMDDLKKNEEAGVRISSKQ